MANSKLHLFFAVLAMMTLVPVLPINAFCPAVISHRQIHSLTSLKARQARKISENEKPNPKMNSARRKKLGVADDEDEYDLDIALENNTDPFITKVIAGSLILAITGLLVAGVIVPATTDYGEGVCNALLTGGRC
jgi:hypothetical protein